MRKFTLKLGLSAALLLLGFSILPGAADGAEVTIAPGQACTSAQCHERFGKDRIVHPAMEDGDCSSCHEQTGDEHEFEYPAEDNDLCYICHDTFDRKKNQHPALEEGCVTCHNPHQSKMEKLIQEESLKSLCFRCHDESMLAAEWTHAPAEMGGCAICHNPHESDNRSLLNSPPSSLCVMCHDDMDEAFRNDTSIHPPAREDCTDCHNPHGADREFLIVDKIPDLCFGCHGDIEETVSSATVKHTVIEKDRRCLNCHKPHTSKYDSLLVRETGEICYSCHDKIIETPGGPIKNMKEWVDTNEYVHVPVEEGECASCHDPHGSTTFRLLKEKFPERFFAFFSEEEYALCFICHDPDFVVTETTEDLTDFRDGSRNLHYHHVNKMSFRCNSCHDVHASGKIRQIRETSPLGRREAPLNFEKTKNGGSCAPGCHDKAAYDREKPVKTE